MRALLGSKMHMKTAAKFIMSDPVPEETVPPPETLRTSVTKTAIGIGCSGAVSVLVKLGTTGDLPGSLSMGVNVTTLFTIMQGLGVSERVSKYLQRPGKAYIGANVASIFASLALKGEITRESYMEGIAPYLLALWFIDVTGKPFIDHCLGPESLKPQSWKYGANLVLTAGLILLAATFGIGMLGQSSFLEVFLNVSTPFMVAAILNKIVQDIFSYICKKKPKIAVALQASRAEILSAEIEKSINEELLLEQLRLASAGLQETYNGLEALGIRVDLSLVNALQHCQISLAELARTKGESTGIGFTIESPQGSELRVRVPKRLDIKSSPNGSSRTFQSQSADQATTPHS